VAGLVEDKNTSIRRLRQLFFGKRTEKTKTLVENGAAKSAPPPEAIPSTPRRDAGLSEGGPDQGQAEQTERARPVAKGHGRNGADAYRGAERSDVPHPSLKAGAGCPTCGEGIVYAKAPGVLVRISGQPPLTAKIYELQSVATCAARCSRPSRRPRRASASTMPRPAA
jgi:hypothetical protein